MIDESKPVFFFMDELIGWFIGEAREVLVHMLWQSRARPIVRIEAANGVPCSVWQNGAEQRRLRPPRQQALLQDRDVKVNRIEEPDRHDESDNTDCGIHEPPQ